jgi:hypothetical protein
VLAVLIAALAHDVPEQHAALRRIDHEFHRGSKHAERQGKRADRGRLLLIGWHGLCSCACHLVFFSHGRGCAVSSSAAFAPIPLPHHLEQDVGVGIGMMSLLAAAIGVVRHRLWGVLGLGLALRLRKSGGSHDGHHRGGDADIAQCYISSVNGRRPASANFTVPDDR